MEELHTTRVMEPHKHQVVKITSKGETFFRVLGSWYGGFAGSDSWRMSSVIQGVEDAGTHYIVRNHSGSIYICGKNNEGMSMLAESIYSGYVKDASESEDLSIELSSIGECIEFLKENK